MKHELKWTKYLLTYTKGDGSRITVESLVDGVLAAKLEKAKAAHPDHKFDEVFSQVEYKSVIDTGASIETDRRAPRGMFGCANKY